MLGQAAQLVNEYLAQLVVSSQRPDYLVQSPRLEWISPNGAFDPTKPLEGEPVYRLAWVVDVRTAGATSRYLALVTMYVDAGDGRLLGGDVVE